MRKRKPVRGWNRESMVFIRMTFCLRQPDGGKRSSLFCMGIYKTVVSEPKKMRRFMMQKTEETK